MEIDTKKELEFVNASKGRVIDWAAACGFELGFGMLTAIHAELLTMYETGYRHCDENWQAEMRDRGAERDLSEG